MTQRNKRVRKAIQLIIDCQRHSSGWESLYHWVDLIDETLKVMSQWGHNCLITNRQIGVMLTMHPAFAKRFHKERQKIIPMYMILIDDERDFIITKDDKKVMTMIPKFDA